MVSLGDSAAGIEYKKDSPWVRLSHKGEQYFLRPGYKAERAIRLGTEENIQVFCEIIKPLTVPLFKCTCEAKGINIVATTPTQAANRFLDEIEVTKKHWSGPMFFGFLRKDVLELLQTKIQPVPEFAGAPNHQDINTAEQLATFTTGSDSTLINIVKKSGKVVNWLGIKYIGKDTPNSVKWSYCHNGKHLLLGSGYDARQLICHNGKPFEVSCQLIQQSELGEFGPLFRCEVLQDGQTVFTFAEIKPTTTLNKVFEYLKLENYKKNLSGYEFFGLTRPEVIQQLHQCSNKVNV